MAMAVAEIPYPFLPLGVNANYQLLICESFAGLLA